MNPGGWAGLILAAAITGVVIPSGWKLLGALRELRDSVANVNVSLVTVTENQKHLKDDVLAAKEDIVHIKEHGSDRLDEIVRNSMFRGASAGILVILGALGAKILGDSRRR